MKILLDEIILETYDRPGSKKYFAELNNPTVLEVKDTLEEYITIDEVSTFDELEKTVKNHSSQFENMWKYLDIIMDMLSDDGAKIKRLEDRLNPKEQDLNSA